MNDWGSALEFWRVPWGERLLQASFQGAIVLAIAWAIAHWCTFLSQRVVCWVWRLACLKIVVSFLCVPPIGLPLLPAKAQTTVASEASPPVEAAAQAFSQEPPPIERPLFDDADDARPRAVANEGGAFPVWQLLWLAGACGFVATTLGRWRLVRLLCGAAQPSRSIKLARLLRLEADRLRVRSIPELRISSEADGPLLAGVWRPVIVLPHRVAESLDESELGLILAHELAHLKRRDLLWNWLPTVVGWVLWFHPLVWLMKGRWSEAQEAACDEMLIQNQAAGAAEYGRLLLKLAVGFPRQPGSSLAAVGMFGSDRNLERRILAMVRVRAYSPGRLVMAAEIVFLVAVPGIVPWRLVAQEPDRAAQPVVKAQPAPVEKSPLFDAKNSKFTELAQRGLVAFEKRDFARALACFNDAIAIDPNHSEARRWRGDALLNQGEFDKALAAYDEAIRLDPKNAMAYVSRGMAWTEKNEPGRALAAFETAVRLDPNQAKRPLYRRYLAAAQGLRTDTDNPKFTEVAKRGLAAFAQKDFAQALACFDEAIALDPNHSEARRWRGDALLNQHEFDKALAAYEDAIRIDPKNVLAYVSRGMAWTEKREPVPALVAFGTAIRLDAYQAKRPLVKRYLAAARSLLPATGIAGFGHPEKEKSPFAAVRWQGAQPEVKVGDEWFKLVSLNGIPAAEIVAFSKKNFDEQWQMRFEEDLVELLTRMGHPPGNTATLVVQSLTAPKPVTLFGVRMTKANRWAIKRAGDARRAAER